jgi:hypothetical protein
MKRNTLKIVTEILQENPMARKEDNYLIREYILRVMPDYMLTNEFISCWNIVSEFMVAEGISFESITRARRKAQEENPKLKDYYTAQARAYEQELYHTYYGRGG